MRQRPMCVHNVGTVSMSHARTRACSYENAHRGSGSIARNSIEWKESANELKN